MMLVVALHESAFGPFLSFAALRRDVGNVMESGPNAHIAASRSLRWSSMKGV